MVLQRNPAGIRPTSCYTYHLNSTTTLSPHRLLCLPCLAQSVHTERKGGSSTKRKHYITLLAFQLVRWIDIYVELLRIFRENIGLKLTRGAAVGAQPIINFHMSACQMRHRHKVRFLLYPARHGIYLSVHPPDIELQPLKSQSISWPLSNVSGCWRYCFCIALSSTRYSFTVRFFPFLPPCAQQTRMCVEAYGINLGIMFPLTIGIKNLNRDLHATPLSEINYNNHYLNSPIYPKTTRLRTVWLIHDLVYIV